MSLTATAEALRIEGLSWRPASRREPTLREVTLRVPPGQRVLLAGPSGAGKSTLLRALAGLLDPEAGDVSGAASAPARPGERALLLQQPVHALVAASVARDAAFGPENAALRRGEIAAAVRDALDGARVDADAAADPFDLSGGQQQRVALAGSLALSPAVLLLDEPTSMLDPATADAVAGAILDVAEGRTLVVADHRPERWLPHVDRVVLLGTGGRILADGPPGSVPLPAPTAPTPTAPAPVSPAPAAAEGDGTVRPAEPVAALRDATIRRRGGGARRGGAVLHAHVDLEVRAGRLTALTGPSGAGKTTLLRVLMGLDAPAAGSVHRPEGSRIALVPQEPEHSFVARTVREEVTASPWADPDRAEALLAAADLAHLAEANPFTLSGGEQRRLAIVAALAQRPRLLVLDEPTVGLDEERLAAVLALLEAARAEGCALLAATHDERLISRADAVRELPAPAADGGRPSREIRPPVRRAPAGACNPLTLCAIGLLAAIGSFTVSSWQIGALALAPVALLAPLAVPSARSALLRLAPILLSAATLAWTTALLSPLAPLSGEAWLLGAKEAARITLFAAPGVLALASVDVTALGDALRDRLRLPGRPIAAGVAALVRIGHLRAQWQRILEARLLRGLGTARSPRLLASATLALLVDTLRGAEQQALAMDARGFAQADARTTALPSRFGRADVLGALVGVLLLVLPWALHLLGSPTLVA